MNYQLTIGWLYPDLMSTYGDRGNIICLKKRCQWRGIEVKVVNIEFTTSELEIANCHLILGGGAQDRQQSLAVSDLHKKAKIFIKLFKKGTPGLFVCGSPQLLGKYYTTASGTKLKGLGIFDYVTIHPGLNKPRLIGNTAGRIIISQKTIVGFENHGGRTYLGQKVKPFAEVLSGFGNNGQDKTEGAVYKNIIACYYHGPFLPKNPHIADWLIKRALEIKYKKDIQLMPLPDSLEWQAHHFILNKLKVI